MFRSQILLNIASLKNLNEEVATLKKELTRVSSQNDALLQEVSRFATPRIANAEDHY